MIWSYERWKVRQNLRVLRLFVLSFVEYLWIEAGKIIFIVEKALQLELAAPQMVLSFQKSRCEFANAFLP